MEFKQVRTTTRRFPGENDSWKGFSAQSSFQLDVQLCAEVGQVAVGPVWQQCSLSPKLCPCFSLHVQKMELLSLSVDEFPTLDDYNMEMRSTFLLSYFYHRSANPGCDFLSELWKICFCGIFFWTIWPWVSWNLLSISRTPYTKCSQAIANLHSYSGRDQTVQNNC